MRNEGKSRRRPSHTPIGGNRKTKKQSRSTGRQPLCLKSKKLKEKKRSPALEAKTEKKKKRLKAGRPKQGTGLNTRWKISGLKELEKDNKKKKKGT